jgi:hypothetical protein
MRTAIVYRKIKVSEESLRFCGAIPVSYHIEWYSDSVMTNGKSPCFVSWSLRLSSSPYPDSFHLTFLSHAIERWRDKNRFWILVPASLLHSLRTKQTGRWNRLPPSTVLCSYCTRQISYLIFLFVIAFCTVNEI